MGLRYAVHGILKNKIFTLLLIIQLTFAFYALYNTIQISKTVETEANKISYYFKNNKIYKLLCNDSNIFDMEKYPKINEKSLQKTFDTLKSYSGLNFSHQVLFPLTIESFKNHEGFKFYNPETEFEGKTFFQAKTIVLNENSLNEFKLQLENGRFFSKEELSRDYGDSNCLPIIVGANYTKYYKIGDEIDYFRPGPGIIKAKIIGILKENQYLPMDMMAFDGKRYSDLNNYIIASYAVFENSNIMFDTMFDYNFMIYNSNATIESIKTTNKDILNAFHENLGLNVDINDLNGFIKAEYDTFESQKKIMSVTSITIFIFVSITLIVSILNSIIKRKKEFGIHIFCGSTLKNIVITNYLEVLIILIFSFILSMAAIFWKNGTVDKNIILTLFISLIFMSALITVIPAVKIFRLSINDIIKGAE